MTPRQRAAGKERRIGPPSLRPTPGPLPPVSRQPLLRLFGFPLSEGKINFFLETSNRTIYRSNLSS